MTTELTCTLTLTASQVEGLREILIEHMAKDDCRAGEHYAANDSANARWYAARASRTAEMLAQLERARENAQY
jgi:hypothetical protein